MFDTYHTHTRPSRSTVTVDQHTEITVKKAPTDESVRLLREMEATARQNVIAAISVGSAALDIKLLVETKYMGLELELTLMININGQRRECHLSLPDNFKALPKKAKIEALQTAAGNALAAVFLSNLSAKTEVQVLLKKLLGDY